MKFKTVFLGISLGLVSSVGFIGGSIDTRAPGWVVLAQPAEASPYRRSVRRTARRTARRTSHRHDYYY